MRLVYACNYQRLLKSWASFILFILILFEGVPIQLKAQDYVIDRGVLATNYAGIMRMAVVDKNEFYGSYKDSNSKIVVQRYKSGVTSQFGTSTGFPDAGNSGDIVRDSTNNVLYISFNNSTSDKIYTYKKGTTDPDWVLVNTLDKPSTNNLSWINRLAFNKKSGTLFLSFSEQNTNKVYFYELVGGVWVSRAGITSMSCFNSWIDLVAYDNKVILTTTPLIGVKYTLKVHVWDISSNTLTTLPDYSNGNFGNTQFATTAYNIYNNEYVSFFAQIGAPKVLKSVAGGAWTDMSAGLSGSIDNGSWGSYIVYNNLRQKYVLVYSSGSIKCSVYDGTTWNSVSVPYMSSTNTFATVNYKDIYFIAWYASVKVGIESYNEGPLRNTVNILATPSASSCDLAFPDRGTGAKVAIFIKKGDTYDIPSIADSTTYTASTVFGNGTQLGTSGWYCVYNGSGQNVTVTGLAGGTYQVQAFEYNGLPSVENYWSGGTVTGNPVSFIAEVSCKDPASGGIIASDQEIAYNTTPTSLTNSVDPSGQNGILEYKWQISPSGPSNGFADIMPAQGGSGYSPGNLKVTTWYKRLARVGCSADWTTAVASNVVKITVDPLSVGGIITGPTTCTYGSQTGIMTLSGYTGSIQKWQKKSESGDWADIDGSNSFTFIDTTTSAAVWSYRAVVKSGVNAAAYSDPFNVTVGKKPITVTPDPGLSKIYGSTDPVFTYTLSSPLVTGDAFTGTLGRVSGETAGDFDYTLGNLNAGLNYSITLNAASPKFKIIVKVLTDNSSVVTTTKVYDGTATAIVTKGTLAGILSADLAGMDFSITATYNDANIGSGKTINVSYALTGAKASNYAAPANYTISNAKILEAVIVNNDQFAVTACDGGKVSIKYSVTSGSPKYYRLTFSQAALNAGFRNIQSGNLPSNNAVDTIEFPSPANLAGGDYDAQLVFTNILGVESQVYNLKITMRLSSDFVISKFTDVVLVNNTSGAYTSYQWYKDNVMINGATKQYYIDPNGLVGNYSVKVVTTDGKTILSCGKTLNIPLYKGIELYVFPNPVVIGESFAVRVTNFTDADLKNAVINIYNTLGGLAYTTNVVHDVNYIALTKAGTYVGVLISGTGKQYQFKVVIRN